jgi:hypothetical protein
MYFSGKLVCDVVQAYCYGMIRMTIGSNIN